MKKLFEKSQNSLGSSEQAKKLRKENILVTRHRVRKVMQQLGLKVTQRVTYRITTHRKYTDSVTDNLLNQQFNPLGKTQVWACDVTYLKTGEGWMYLAAVMDLYSRRIVGCAIDKRMTTSLSSSALIKAYNLRQPSKGLVSHSDRGSQYTSNAFEKLLKSNSIGASMGDVGACWENAVVTRFSSSLKHDWIFKVHQPTRAHMKQNVAAYMKSYNLVRLQSSKGDLSPMEYEELAN